MTPTAVLEELHANGGFPEPPASAPARIIAAHHDRCGASTRVRVPGAVPARAIRRLRCAECDQVFDAAESEDLGIEAIDLAGPEVEAPAVDALVAVAEPEDSDTGAIDADEGMGTREPPVAKLRRKLSWQWLSVPAGAAVVIAALLLIQGGDPPAPPLSQVAGDAGPAAKGAPAGTKAATRDGRSGPGRARGKARLLRGSGYALALPPGWERDRDPGGGAALALAATDGSADATLWVERAPDLDLASFEQRSLDQLRSLAGSARVVDRVSAPRPEATIIRLAADAPAGQPRLEVTLRAAGPFRYYLATTVQPDAGRAAADGAELIHGSFTPETGGRG